MGSGGRGRGLITLTPCVPRYGGGEEGGGELMAARGEEKTE